MSSPEQTSNLKSDLAAGFLVFLIALPLCLGISLACGYPAVAGIFTAIIGGLVATWLSDSQLTIKGPAAGLIVIVLGAMQEFGYTGGQNPAADFQAYKLVLGVSVVAGLFQIAAGLLRAGTLGDFFPSAAVHGLLASIGIIIISKQIPIMLGVSAKGGPIEMLLNIPKYVVNMNPEIAVIGVLSLALLFLLPALKSKALKRIPGQMLVLIISVPLGIYFDLSHEHTYTWSHHSYQLSEKFLVAVPAQLFSAVTVPDFSGLARGAAWVWVAMFSIIGSLESILSAKAVDIIDPQRRKTNLNRDLLGVGVGNTIAAFIGGLPMISEIVRSRANLDNGAKSKMSNFFHGMFLLLALALMPSLIHRIPLAALAAMLVYTGFRLAHPKEFLHVYEIGTEQFLVFTGTIVGVLATDLLVGIFIGLGIELLCHFFHGVKPTALFGKPTHARTENTVTLVPGQAAVFTNWLRIRKVIETEGLNRKSHVVVDFSQTVLVDHSTIAKLTDLSREFESHALRLSIQGLHGHRGLSKHPLSTMKRNRVEAVAKGSRS